MKRTFWFFDISYYIFIPLRASCWYCCFQTLLVLINLKIMTYKRASAPKWQCVSGYKKILWCILKLLCDWLNILHGFLRQLFRTFILSNFWQRYDRNWSQQFDLFQNQFFFFFNSVINWLHFRTIIYHLNKELGFLQILNK